MEVFGRGLKFVDRGNRTLDLGIDDTVFYYWTITPPLRVSLGCISRCVSVRWCVIPKYQTTMVRWTDASEEAPASPATLSHYLQLPPGDTTNAPEATLTTTLEALLTD